MKHEKQQRVNHTAEFKREAVELVLSSERSVPQIAVELGISVSNLRRWKRGYHTRPGQAGVSRPGPSSGR